MQKPIVGISFTSRNRPDLLEICLNQTLKNLSPEKYEYNISVCVDEGDPEYDMKYINLIPKFPFVVHGMSLEERLGIARNKNEGIRIMRANDCDHFFLSDDDTFPQKKGWEDLYINAARENNVGHLMHLFAIKKRYEILKTENGLSKSLGSCGAFLYFTKHAIDTVGGMRKAFKIYSDEHTEIALRCDRAGLQGKWGAYASPENSRDYIYAMDLELTMFGIQPKDVYIDPSLCRSSVEGEDFSMYAEDNARIMHTLDPIFEEI